MSDLLDTFFLNGDQPTFQQAIRLLCEFFNLKTPEVEWFEWLDRGKSIGATYENGKIELTHPDHFKTNRKYNTVEQWRNAVFHELGHYIFWVDAERKANLFARRMEANLGKAVWREDVNKEASGTGTLKRTNGS